MPVLLLKEHSAGDRASHPQIDHQPRKAGRISTFLWAKFVFFFNLMTFYLNDVIFRVSDLM